MRPIKTALVATLTAYFTASAYDYYLRDDLSPTPFITSFPPTFLIGKSIVGLKGYDGNVIKGYEDGYDSNIQWEINKGNRDNAYKKKLVSLYISSILNYQEPWIKKSILQALPGEYRNELPESEASKATPAQEFAGSVLIQQIISSKYDTEIRETLKRTESIKYE